MKAIAFLAGCLIASPLCALEQVGPIITLDAEELGACESGGGCIVAPKAKLEAAVEAYAARAYAAGKASCRNST
jgi:hypothetical protein